jgi:hypothetical protein
MLISTDDACLGIDADRSEMVWLHFLQDNYLYNSTGIVHGQIGLHQHGFDMFLSC